AQRCLVESDLALLAAQSRLRANARQNAGEKCSPAQAAALAARRSAGYE
ncbi:MAG: hypothetical protein IT514_16675, partial [Burkholderiales bacterium]|nr:hypothetical protein [Burkholderiales bacterium]